MIELPNGLHIRRSIFEDARLSWSQRLVYALLQHVGATKAPEDEWPTYPEIATTLKISTRTVTHALRTLEEWSYLKRRGKGSQAAYKLVYATDS